MASSLYITETNTTLKLRFTATTHLAKETQFAHSAKSREKGLTIDEVKQKVNAPFQV